MLELDQLSASYGKAMALESISLRVLPGELVAVLGPNGAGKSTLLKAISRAIDSQGGLTFEGQSLHNVATEKVVGLRICHCPEGRRLFPELSVLKNLQLGAYLRHDKAAVAADLNNVYQLFPILQERGSQMVSTLSGGQQQMVAIGRALMGAPKLLLLDEMVSGMNSEETEDIARFVLDIRDELGISVLMVEHDMGIVMDISDRVCVLNFGRKIGEGTPAEISANAAVIDAYLGSKTKEAA